MELVTPDVLDFLERDAPFAEEGNLPEDGGTNDQTDSFLRALRQYRNETRYYELNAARS